jgi:hypothetical protein
MANWWEGFAWRLIQTNLREIDMEDISAERFVGDVKEFNASVVMINAAGIIASYPTKLKYHYQSRFLKGDSLKAIIEKCHEAEIRVIARTDFSKIRRDVFKDHPEWAYRTIDGHIIDYEGDIHACINGGYQHDYSFDIVKECITELDFDGIYFNMAGYQARDYANRYYGICHCDSCKKLFMEKYGLLLPEVENSADPVFQKYRVFQRLTTRAHNERLCRFIRSIRPDILIDRDFFTMEKGMIRQESNTALDRPLPHWQYSGSENTKWVRGSFKCSLSSNASVDFWDFPIRHTAVSPVQQETRLWQNLANTGQLDYYLIGRIDNHDDMSGFNSVKRVFSYHKQHEALYQNNESVAEIAMVTEEHWGGFGENREAAGIYRILTEAHYLFDVVFLSRITFVDINKYKLLVLANLVNISDEETDILENFVRQGGMIFCTAGTGSRNGNGEPRKIPALSCMGINAIGVEQNVRGAYFHIDDSEHEFFRRFDGVNLVSIDGSYIYAAYNDDVRGILKMIPPQPFGPPERCYAQRGYVDNYAAIINRSGSGCCVFVPWYPGQLFHRQGYPNTMNFILDMFEHCFKIKPLETDLPPMVEITLSKIGNDNSWLVHLINQTGHFGNSFYPPVTIPRGMCVLPFYGEPALAKSLISGKYIKFSYKNQSLRLDIENLGIVDVIHIHAKS